MCEEIQEILVDEGYHVRTAFNGTEALALIDQHGCDVLLLDLKMPGLDGPAVLRRLKEKHTRPRVVVVTAKLLEDDSVDTTFEEAGVRDLVHDVITKPFDIPRLLAAIKRIADEG
jgi:two-component system response regulator (stage 0 sporulation protein F)